MNELFLKFISKLESPASSYLIEAVDDAFHAIFEARTLPTVEPWIEGKFRLHQYKIVKDAPNSKIYRVVARGGDGKACVMLVQMYKVKPERLVGFISDDVWIINFVKEGQSDFDVTGSGSLDAFNTVFAAIQVMISDIHPDYIAYKPTDSDETKSAQKARIYSGYFTRMGFGEYPKDQLPESMQNLTVFKA